MTIHTTSIPKLVKGKKAVPFKLFFPRQLTAEEARPVWEALEAERDIVLGDPFALPGVSTVYPGTLYARSGSSLADGLKKVASLVEPLQETFPEELADGWVELWIPDALADAVEALDVTDLTQQ
ncbi:hypothetical protein SEA_FRANKLIN22_70 [Microbacterium phage Franklin22]|uniref:hypothetical protein n=1 Tax=Microbacterium phage Franklin22 TaxID=2894293 RepID=UPI001E751C88|nr:hypothetical protein QDW15_gp70 [Microbacterium phage Franklin22]UGL61883.1 hypothetical protein SEA_FRANKLIN22_70 [Microbacterium phage Franklin22]